MSLTRRLVIVAAIELAFVIATRIVLHYFPWSSVEAESIRSVLRLTTAAAYWWLLRPLILSRTPNPLALRSSVLATGLLLFLSIPVLVGHYQLSAPTALLFAIASVPVAIKEEFLFRGIIQNLLAQRFGALKAVLITSTIFTAWHLGVWEFTPWVFSQIFFASVLLGLIYIYSGSIAFVMAIHAIYDALFSFTPLVSASLSENWGFLPLLASVAIVSYWAWGIGRATQGVPSHG
ncbi:MAG: CPBP family intramembrane glutamic endopeptidase [Candidatus Ferrigenium altingense]